MNDPKRPLANVLAGKLNFKGWWRFSRILGIQLEKVTQVCVSLLTYIFVASVEVLKVVSATFLLVCIKRLKESACETRKNVFYFTSNTLFVLEIIKF